MPEAEPNKDDKINVTDLVNRAVRDADNEVRLHVENVTDLASKDKEDFFSVLSRYQKRASKTPKGLQRPRLMSLLDTAGFAVNTNLNDAGTNLSSPKGPE